MSTSQALDRFTYLRSANLDYIEESFERYLRDPDSVDSSWRNLFEGMELGAEVALAELSDQGRLAPQTSSQSQPQGSSNGTYPSTAAASSAKPGSTPSVEGNEWKVAELIFAYREFGRLLASTNPLSPAPSSHPYLELERFGLGTADLSRTFQVGRWLGLGTAPLSKILEHLKQVYCGSMGIDLQVVADQNERKWLTEKLEAGAVHNKPPIETRKFILRRLTEVESFERFLHTRYVAQKRFSVEGGDGLIPALDSLLDKSAESGTSEIVLGMAHRGRLSVLHSVLRFPTEMTLTQFEGKYEVDLSKGEGDVKYHMGYSSDVVSRSGKPMHISLAFNPSHLEVVNPVVLGMARAKQEVRKDADRSVVVPIVIHGDAAFSGQGVCFESLNFVGLEGYATGGSVHIIVNNQVGFTTSPKDSRSTPYATDLARTVGAPIFHVNGDDADAVWQVSQLAMEYRMRFKKDVFIDLICYRKHGHNEGDEPAFTQPLLYKQIKTHPSPREVYVKRLTQDGIVDQAQATAWVEEQLQLLTQAQTRTRETNPPPKVSSFEGRWKGLQQGSLEDWFKPVKTSLDGAILQEIAQQLNSIPSSFNVHPKLQRFFDSRLKAVQSGKGIDWGNGEALAFASLLTEGHSVRITGQDAERGTFSHRHSVLNDFETGERYSPFWHLKGNGGKYQVHNSHLSELGVMGFEFGYSLAEPHGLTIWEAQFGDFSNGAQMIIDQFLSASESKWQRLSGLTLLLPHGYEGQGPEHSSARLERYLQLSGRGNWAVCNLTTPAQLFHALRRQVKRNFRKPLIIMSPKSLLRHPLAISGLEEFTQQQFNEVLGDTEADARSTKQVLLCTGKVYYDLLQERTHRKRTDIAILRVEQLYPWPASQVAQALKKYSSAKQVVWVQEEPRNMGSWSYVHAQWTGALGESHPDLVTRPLCYVGREVAASPAVGSAKIHEKQQRSLIEKAFEPQ